MVNRTSRDRLARQRAAVATRRLNAHRGEPPPEAPQRGRGWIVGVVVCSLVLVAVVVVALYHGSSGSSASATPSSVLTATLVDGASGALSLTAAPSAYTVTYALQSSDDTGDASDTGGASDTTPATEPPVRTYTTSTEEFRVQRPFRTHIDSKTGAPPGGDVQWSIVSALGLSSSVAAGDEAAKVETITPTAGIGDWRLDAVLADLVADKTFVVRERRTLLGRDCQVYRTGSPLENNQITAPTDATYADVCIDGSGLVLEQVAISAGAVLEHLTATAVDPAATLTDADFAISGSPASLADGGMSLAPIGGAPADDSYWGFPTAPAGYEPAGRYTLSQNATDQSAVTPSGQSAEASATTTGPTGLDATTVVISYVDVYTNGPDTVVVVQGPTSVEPSDDNPGAGATSAALGSVTIESKLTGSQIIGHPAATPDWFVEVSGTVSRSGLLSMADSLVNSPASS